MDEHARVQYEFFTADLLRDSIMWCLMNCCCGLPVHQKAYLVKIVAVHSMLLVVRFYYDCRTEFAPGWAQHTFL